MKLETLFSKIRVAFLLAGLASLLACGGQTGKDTVELFVMDADPRPASREIWNNTIALFHEKHPGVKVDVRLYKDDDYTKLHLPQALNSRRPPDTYFQWAGFAVHRDGRGGIARDLTDDLDAAWKERFDPRAFRGTLHNGRNFLVPVGMDVSNVIWYRKSILADRGIEPPRTWEAFVAAGRKLKADGITPIVHGNQAGWPAGNWAAHIAEMYLGIDAYAAIGDPKSTQSVALNDPRIVKAVALIEDIARQGFFNSDINTLDNAEGVGLFNRGEGAFHFDGGWIVEDLTDPDDVGVLPQPTPPGDVADPNSVLATAAGMMVHARSPHPELALDLLRALTSPPIQQQSVDIGRMTTLKAELIKVKSPLQEANRKLLNKASTWVAAPDISWHPATAEEFNRAVKEVVGGQATAKEALDAAVRNLAR